MSRVWFTGFEQNSLDIFDTVVGGPVVSPTDPRSAQYDLWTPTVAGHVTVYITPLRAEVFVRLYVKITSGVPVATELWFRLSDSNGVVLLDITETGQVWLGGIGGVDKGNAGPLTNEYKRWEIRLQVDNTVGLFDVRVDGISMLSDSGIDTRIGVVDDVGELFFGTIDIGGVAGRPKRFDDVAINNTLGVVSNSWPGPGSVLARDPDADGAVLQYTPLGGGNHYDKVNAINDATYVYDDTPGHIDLWEKPPMLSYGNYIVAIAWWLRAERAAGAAGIVLEYRQLGTNWNLGSTRALTASWDYYGYFTSENPIFLGMLTRGLIDAAEFGVKSIS